MSESALWKTLKKHLSSRGHLIRVESSVGLGVPDVNYCFSGKDGWIELKEIKQFPKRPDTPVRLPHFTSAQRNWLRRRAQCGGRVFVLVRVLRGGIWMLFDGVWAAEHLGYEPKEVLLLEALTHKNISFPTEAVLSCLLR